MKTLMLVDNYPPETTANARIFSELAEELAKYGLDVSVITSHPNFPKGKIFPGYKNKWRSKLVKNGVQVIRVKSYMHPNEGVFRRTLDFISFGVSSLFFGLFERKTDCIIGITPQFFCALSGCLLSILKKKPFILILCDLWPDSIISNKMISKGFIFNITKKLEYFMYRRASIIAILSPYFRKYLNQAKIDNSKIIDFISEPNKFFSPREKKQTLLNKYNLQNKLVIGYIGTFGISHNHKDIINVFKSLKRSDIHLFMIGDGVKKDDLNNLIKEYKLSNITIDGPVKLAEVPDYWSVCDVAIIPLASTQTNKTVIPSKVLEAMGMGLPAILYTPPGEVTRFFSESKAIWHIESGNVECLEQFTKGLSEEIILEKKKKAIEFAKNFSRENQANILLDNIHAICNREGV